MNIFNLRYCPIGFFYDKEKVKGEIFQHSFHEIPAIKNFLPYRPFDLVDKELYDKVTVYSENGIEVKEIPSWKGYSFTHIPGDAYSSYGGNLVRITNDKWEWKKDANCPYIQSLVDELGFLQIQNVRAMVLEPPGFGPVHRDLPHDSNYYDNHVSITLNISDGGVPLVAMINDKLEFLNDDCFLFRDDCWHGVDKVLSQRVQLRINGIIDQNKLKKFITKKQFID